MDTQNLVILIGAGTILVLSTFPRIYWLLTAKKRIREGKNLLETWSPKGAMKLQIEAEMQSWKELYNKAKFFWQKEIDL
jgi:hypothetical protein